jgi:CHAT domain-containing protein
MTVCLGEAKITCVGMVQGAVAVLLAALLAGAVMAEDTTEPQLRQQQQALHAIQQQALEAYERTDYTQALGLYRQLWEQAEQMQRFTQPAPGSWQALYNRNIDDATIAGLDGVAACLSSLGEFEQAQALYQRELSRLEASGDAVRLATVHNRLGFISQQLGQFEPALRQFNTALAQAGKAARDIEAAFAQEGGDLAAVLRLINALTTVRSNMMNAAAALYQLGRYEEVVSLYDRDDWQRCERIFTHAVDGLPADSADMLGQTLRLANLTSDIRVLSDRGVAYHAIAAETGEAATYQKAADLLQEAVRLARQLPDHHNLLLIATLGHLGYALEGLQRYPEALAAHTEALQLARLLPASEARFKVQPAINLAHVYLEQHDTAAARQALTGVETPDLEKDRETLWYVHNLYGRLFEMEGDVASAAVRFRQAIAVIEDLRASVLTPELKQTFFRKHRAPYENLVRVLQQLAQPGEALYIMEQMRARSLADQLHNVLITKGVTPGLRQQEEELAAQRLRAYVQHNRARATTHEPETRAMTVVTSALQPAERTFQDVLQAAPEYASLKGADPMRPEALEAYLDDDTLLVSYVLGERTAMVATLARGGRATIAPLSPPDPRQIEAAVARLLDQLSHPDQEGWRAASAQLYQMLISPVAREIQGHKRLLIIPSGLLYYLPFGVLAKPGSGPLLVESHRIVVLPSATVLQFCRAKNRKERKTAVIFALGNISRPTFETLPGTLTEARAIAQTMPGAQLLLEQQFTRAQVEKLSAHRDIVHFATHGFLDSHQPLQSGVATADGTLAIADVFNLSLDANLVTLSACQTGLGKLLRGDEVIGLTRAFMYAGTPSVLATLWSVADASTAQFMTLFYQALQQSGADKGSAIQQAQLELMQAYPHPYYWAPFQLLGDWQ